MDFRIMNRNLWVQGMHGFCRDYLDRGWKSRFWRIAIHNKWGGILMKAKPIDLTIEMGSLKLLKSIRQVENEELEREILEGVAELMRSFVEGCSRCLTKTSMKGVEIYWIK